MSCHPYHPCHPWSPLSCLPVTEPRFKRVCYYTNWSQYRKKGGRFLPTNIDPFLCTHVVFAFAKLDHKGNLAPYEWNDVQYPCEYPYPYPLSLCVSSTRCLSVCPVPL